MSLLKKIMLAASLLVASSFASAATYDLNLLDYTVDSKAVLVTPTGSFNDLFEFTIDDNFFVSQVMDTLGDFSFLQYALYDSSATLIESATVGFDNKLRIDSLLLGPGSYTTAVSGYLDGSFGGYSFATAITPVPEASTIAMMLGGLGLVGFMARRRKVA